jgi:hypothetical protein
MNTTRERVYDWLTAADRRALAALIGVAIGTVGAGIGFAIALVGPLYTTAAVIGLLTGVYVLTDIRVALYGLVGMVALLPFGTLPFSIGFTPTLIDVMIGAFLLIYLLQWMTGQRREFRITPVHIPLALYVLWILAAFALGLRYAEPTTQILRQFAELMLTFLLVYVLVDLIRDVRTLRRLVLVVIVCVGVQALMALVLWALPNPTAERLLRLLSRIGYPDSNIIRYIEQNPALSERAIGTWVDPNSLAGTLAVSAAMIAPQAFAVRPVLRYRWLTLGVLGVVGLALLLTFSRSSMLAFGAALGLIALARYRRFIPLMLAAALLIVLLPQTQGYVERFIDAFQGEDLATQMRIGEISDSLRLIQEYPLFGIGFTGSPRIDLYSSVANLYLLIANQIGLVGLGLYLGTMGGVFAYGWRAWRWAKQDAELDSIHLGYHAAVFAALVNGIGDFYYFRIDYQGSIVLFWLMVSLALASSRLALDKTASAPAGTAHQR